MENINLETRTNILRYSLDIESHINALLLGHLGITEKQKTKNFGNKAGISFKSKIDLLFDIEVLNIEEHKDLELLMNFRNKFLHDIDSTSFTYILKNIDSGIKNRFLKFMETDTTPVEKDYELACNYLYLHNLKVISKKHKERIDSITNRTNYLTSLYDSYISLNELSADFAKEVMFSVGNSHLENVVILSAFEPIIKSCLNFEKNYILESEKIYKLGEMHDNLPKRKMII